MDSNDKTTSVFLSLLMTHQRRINSYILSVVPNFSDADDIMQETIAVMWKKFGEFQAETDFDRWGLKIAYYCILNYRKRKGKDKLVFSETLFQQIHDVAKETPHDADERITYLRQCIQALTSPDQRLLKARYELNCSAEGLADQLGRSVQYVYKHLARIHHTLSLCVKRTIREREAL